MHLMYLIINYYWHDIRYTYYFIELYSNKNGFITKHRKFSDFVFCSNIFFCSTIILNIIFNLLVNICVGLSHYSFKLSYDMQWKNIKKCLKNKGFFVITTFLNMVNIDRYMQSSDLSNIHCWKTILPWVVLTPPPSFKFDTGYNLLWFQIVCFFSFKIIL